MTFFPSRSTSIPTTISVNSSASDHPSISPPQQQPAANPGVSSLAQRRLAQSSTAQLQQLNPGSISRIVSKEVPGQKQGPVSRPLPHPPPSSKPSLSSVAQSVSNATLAPKQEQAPRPQSTTSSSPKPALLHPSQHSVVQAVSKATLTPQQGQVPRFQSIPSSSPKPALPSPSRPPVPQFVSQQQRQLRPLPTPSLPHSPQPPVQQQEQAIVPKTQNLISPQQQAAQGLTGSVSCPESLHQSITHPLPITDVRLFLYAPLYKKREIEDEIASFQEAVLALASLREQTCTSCIVQMDPPSEIEQLNHQCSRLYVEGDSINSYIVLEHPSMPVETRVAFERSRSILNCMRREIDQYYTLPQTVEMHCSSIHSLSSTKRNDPTPTKQLQPKKLAATLLKLEELTCQAVEAIWTEGSDQTDLLRKNEIGLAEIQSSLSTNHDGTTFVNRDFAQVLLHHTQDNIALARALSSTFAESLRHLRTIEKNIQAYQKDLRHNGGLIDLHVAFKSYVEATKVLSEMKRAWPTDPSPAIIDATHRIEKTLEIYRISIFTYCAKLTVTMDEREEALSVWATGVINRPVSLTNFIIKMLLKRTIFGEERDLQPLLDGCLIHVNDKREFAKIAPLVAAYEQEQRAPTTKWLSQIIVVQGFLNEMFEGLFSSTELEAINTHHSLEVKLVKFELQPDSSELGPTIQLARAYIQSKGLFPLSSREKALQVAIQQSERCTLNGNLKTLIAKRIICALYSTNAQEREQASKEVNEILNYVNQYAPSIFDLRDLRVLIEAFRASIFQEIKHRIQQNGEDISTAASTVPLWSNSHAKKLSQHALVEVEKRFSGVNETCTDLLQLQKDIEALEEEKSTSWDTVVQLFFIIQRAKLQLKNQRNTHNEQILATFIERIASLYTKKHLLTKQSHALVISLLDPECTCNQPSSRFSKATLAYERLLHEKDERMATERAYAILFPLLLEQAFGIATNTPLIDKLPLIIQKLCLSSSLRAKIRTHLPLAQLIVPLLLLKNPSYCNELDSQTLEVASREGLHCASLLDQDLLCFSEITSFWVKEKWRIIVQKHPQFPIFSKRIVILAQELSTGDFVLFCQKFRAYEETLQEACSCLRIGIPKEIEVQDFVVTPEIERQVADTVESCVQNMEGAQQIVLKGRENIQISLDILRRELTPSFKQTVDRLSTDFFQERIQQIIGTNLPHPISSRLHIAITNLTIESQKHLQIVSAVKEGHADKTALKESIRQYYPRLLLLFSGKTYSQVIDGRWASLPCDLFSDDRAFLREMNRYQGAYCFLCVRPKHEKTSLIDLRNAYASHVDLLISKIIELSSLKSDCPEFKILLQNFISSFRILCSLPIGEPSFKESFAQLIGMFEASSAPCTSSSSALTSLSKHSLLQPNTTCMIAMELIKTGLNKDPYVTEEQLVESLLRTDLSLLIKTLGILIEQLKKEDQHASCVVNLVTRFTSSMKTFLGACATPQYRESLLSFYFQLDSLARKIE